LSGITEQTYPLVYMIFFTYHSHITIVLGSIWMIAAALKACSLRGKDLAYFGRQINFAAILAVCMPFWGPWHAYLTRYGRFWYFIPQACIIANDAFAYFTGKAFGRTKLISVSPSKTVEGWLGGMACNVVQVWFFSSYLIQSAWGDFWICAG
jgi:phosphatidate cytidylyltransferase